jgi:hypothetical protein
MACFAYSPYGHQNRSCASPATNAPPMGAGGHGGVEVNVTYNQTLNGFIWHLIPLDTKLYIDVTIKLPKNGSRRHAKQGI